MVKYSPKALLRTRLKELGYFYSTKTHSFTRFKPTSSGKSKGIRVDVWADESFMTIRECPDCEKWVDKPDNYHTYQGKMPTGKRDLETLVKLLDL